MNDDFMGGLRKTPPPGFEERLREELRAGEAERPVPDDERPAGRWARFARPALVTAAAAAVTVALVASPALRASAQAFLDLFRVKSFAAVSVDPERMKRLEGKDLDLQAILGKQVEELVKPAPPQFFTDEAAAGRAAGLTLRVPSMLPAQLQRDTIVVRGRGAARITADTRKLQEVLNTLGITDVRVPPGLDGARATVRMPAAVSIAYHHGSHRAVLMQSASPEVELPPGVDLAALGEIGLRIAGLSQADAHRFATTLDWRSTVLVPVPTGASTFREVDVQGHRGLMVISTGRAGGAREGAVVLWSDAGRVYALAGNVFREDLLLMANSLR